MNKHWAKAVLTIAMGIAIALVLAETAVRLWLPQPERVIGGQRPDKTNREFDPESRRNSLGFNDREWTPQPEPGTFRIGVLGDSMVEAIQVPRKQNFVTKTEELFNRKCGNRFELLNLGIPGAGTATSYLSLQDNTLPLSPDLVVLVFNASNDVYNNSIELETKQSKPFFVLENSALKRLSPTENITPPKGILWDHSELFRFLIRRGKTSSKMADLVKAGWGIPVPLLVFARESDPVWERAWSLTEALLSAMSEMVHAREIPLAVILLPIELEVDPTAWNRATEQFPAIKKREWTVDKPRERIAAICRGIGIPVIDLYGAFQKKFREDSKPLYFQDDGHLNEAGHHLVTEQLADQLTKAALLPSCNSNL